MYENPNSSEDEASKGYTQKKTSQKYNPKDYTKNLKSDSNKKEPFVNPFKSPNKWALGRPSTLTMFGEAEPIPLTKREDLPI